MSIESFEKRGEMVKIVQLYIFQNIIFSSKNIETSFSVNFVDPDQTDLMIGSATLPFGALFIKSVRQHNNLILHLNNN